MMLDENSRNNRVGRLILIFIFTISLVPRPGPFTKYYMLTRKRMRERGKDG